MSADYAARLRELAREHHAGRLGRAEYRRLRAALVDSLSMPGMDAGAVTRPRAVRPPVDVTRPRPAGARSAAAPAHRPPPRVLARILLAMGLLLLASLTLVWMLRERAPGQTPTPAPMAGAAGVLEPLAAVVQAFMERGDWSDAEVAALHARLRELDGAQLAAVSGEQWFQRFVDEVRKRVKEQQALARAPLTVHSSALAALAATVGLDLSRPDAAPRILPSGPSSAALTHTRADALPVEQPAPGATSPTAGQKASAPPTARQQAGAAPSASAVVQADGLPGERATVPALSDDESTGEHEAAKRTPHAQGCRVELVGSRRPLCHDVLASGAPGPLLALIPAGVLDRGGATGSAEQPMRRARIERPFALSVHEISQEEFQLYCNDTGRPCPAQPWTGSDYPVVNVSWHDAQAYVEWLSASTGQRYSLPSELHWEYAARAGERGAVPGGATLSPTDAHFSMHGVQNLPARRVQPFNRNAFRLMHMLGNVREWVQDPWTEDLNGRTAAPSREGAAARVAAGAMRVVRGGSYADGAARIRFSLREGLPEEARDAFTGFRVMREVP